MQTIAKIIHFSGKVQGVGFRYTTKDLAKGFDLTGAVKNLTDGRVELLIVGAPEELEEFLQELTENSVVADYIKETTIQEIPPPENLKGFIISPSN